MFEVGRSYARQGNVVEKIASHHHRAEVAGDVIVGHVDRGDAREIFVGQAGLLRTIEIPLQVGGGPTVSRTVIRVHDVRLHREFVAVPA